MTTDSTPSKKRSLLRKLLYAAAAVILLGSLLASYMNWEANHLEFSENTAPAGCVPGLSGLRILVLSDVHTNLPLLEKAAAMAEQARPDMIVFLGDLYTDFLRATHAGDYITQMKRLSSIAPAYACLGNHDMALVDNVERILKEGGFTLLRNSAAFVHPQAGERGVQAGGTGRPARGGLLSGPVHESAGIGGRIRDAHHRPEPQPQGEGIAGRLSLEPDALRPYARRPDQTALLFHPPADVRGGNDVLRLPSL